MFRVCDLAFGVIMLSFSASQVAVTPNRVYGVCCIFGWSRGSFMITTNIALYNCGRIYPAALNPRKVLVDSSPGMFSSRADFQNEG